jgi:hypothetical protein
MKFVFADSPELLAISALLERIYPLRGLGEDIPRGSLLTRCESASTLDTLGELGRKDGGQWQRWWAL